jgi:hypothetical protein
MRVASKKIGYYRLLWVTIGYQELPDGNLTAESAEERREGEGSKPPVNAREMA